MAERETVKVYTPDRTDRDWLWKAKENVTEDDTLWRDRAKADEVAEEANGEIDWEIADNGWWTITAQGKEVDRGRGEDSLNEALQERGIDR
jgi:hypothetical protein